MITAAAFLAAVPAFGQGRGGGYKPPEGPAPKLDGKPDFSGMWARPYTPDMSLNATDLNGKPYPPENPKARGEVDPNPPAATPAPGGRGPRQLPRRLPFTKWGIDHWKDYDPIDGDYTGACL